MRLIVCDDFAWFSAEGSSCVASRSYIFFGFVGYAEVSAYSLDSIVFLQSSVGLHFCIDLRWLI